MVEKVLPNAKIVADRFHVAKPYRAAVDELRKIEMKELKQILKKEEYAGLKGVLWALRKKSEDLEPEEREILDLLFESSPLLRKDYSWLLAACDFSSLAFSDSPIFRCYC